MSVGGDVSESIRAEITVWVVNQLHLEEHGPGPEVASEGAGCTVAHGWQKFRFVNVTCYLYPFVLESFRLRLVIKLESSNRQFHSDSIPL